MIRREPAWRVFARELNQSSLTVKDENNDKSPNYLISPLGAKMNRLFVVGVATEINNYGDENDPFWRIRVVDISGGAFFVTAGQFNANVLKKIPKLKEPSFIAVVGKPRTYTPEGTDAVYVSITPEVIKEVEVTQRKMWILEAARALKKRLEDYAYIRENLEEPTRENILGLGFSEPEADGFARAMETYPDTDLEYFRNLMNNALRSLLPQDDNYVGDTIEDAEMSYETQRFQQTGGQQEAAGATPEAGGSEDRSEAVCDLVRASDSEDGIHWNELVEQAKEKLKMDQNQLEEVVNNLLDDGILFEPVLGKLKMV